MAKKISNSVKNVQKLFNSHTITSLLAIILAVFIGGYLVNLFVGGGLIYYNVEGMANGNPEKIVYYYMDGCPACQQFNPIWNEFESQYKGSLTIQKIEQNEAGNDLSKYNIQGFPSVVKLNSNGELMDTFSGDRTVQNLNNFVS